MWSITSFLVGFWGLLLFLLIGNVESYSKNPPVSVPSDELTFPENIILAISGGEASIPKEFTFMAALGWRNKHGVVEFHCGGMLITSKMVLTAAHCIHLDGKLPDIVRLGGDPLIDNKTDLEYAVVNATIFPKYVSDQAYYDIAVLELEYHTEISPICLWTNPIMPVDNATAIGYGLTAFAGVSSQTLLKVNLTVFSEMYCQQFFKRQRKFRQGISQTHICAGDANGQKDTCQGDSGGPLIAYYKNRKYAIGITSTGQACSGFPPAIYTKISSFIGWINAVVNEDGHSNLEYCP